jgi:hypothetical protein
MRRLLSRAGTRREPAGPGDEPFVSRFEEQVGEAFATDAQALERVRTRVVATYRIQVAEQGRRATRRRWFGPARPALAFALALGLLVGSFGLVTASSGPGQPFYGLRLAAEALTLPGSGEARLNGELGRLNQRLAEARQGARAGDARAVAAALDAYRDELAGVLAEGGSSGPDSAAIVDALTVHQVVLDRLESVVPAAAAGGIRQAIDQVGRASERLRSGHGPSSSPAGHAPTQAKPHAPASPESGRATPTTEPPTSEPPTADPQMTSPKPSRSPGTP